MRIDEIISPKSESVNEDLRKWFKDKWVRFGPDGKIRGDCARDSDTEGKPKCLPQSKAHSLGKKGRASAARRKRREDPNPDRKGAAKNVATKKKTTREGLAEDGESKKIIGPFKLIDVSDDLIRVQGHAPLKLSSPITDKLTPGFNYAFEVSGDQILRVMLLTVDMVIHTEDSILMIKRKNQPFADHWALPGGFIDPGETPVQAAIRELQEETGMTVTKAQPVGVFKTPGRDPRMKNTWSYAFKLSVPDHASVRAGDDASAATWIPFSKIKSLPLAFDHKDIISKALGSQIMEKWSAKYKRSINCSDPRGFSQRAHCQGKKKTSESILEFTNIPFTQCPGCGGDIVPESQLHEKQDACYHKVKSRYKVWPSAYASGALVQCRKKGAKNWGKKS